MAKFQELNYEFIEHPAYSSDFAPFDYYLFLNLENTGRNRFTSNDEAIATANGYFADKLESHFHDVIEFLSNVGINVLKFQLIMVIEK